MPDNKNNAKPHPCELESWARALGVSRQRLLALIEEVVNERLSPAISLVPGQMPIMR